MSGESWPQIGDGDDEAEEGDDEEDEDEDEGEDINDHAVDDNDLNDDRRPPEYREFQAAGAFRAGLFAVQVQPN